MKSRFILLVSLALVACAKPAPDAEPEASVDALAQRYVVLELAMGTHDANHVDAYSGPEALRTEAESNGWSLQDIDARAQDLDAALTSIANTQATPRVTGLIDRLRALRMRIAINQGLTVPFDEESQALFAAQAPDYDDAHFDAILAEIDALLPGDAPLPERVESFRNQFTIPADKLDAVFQAAMAECRRRTLAHIDLPANESFTVEYVTDKPWSGYNWYQGDAKSLIQVNTDLPIAISRAVDLGCHEGYPGHHTFNALLEQELKIGEGWIEFSLYPLFSPQSLIAEGTGNYGIDLAFPGDERIQYERDVLFPMAGLDAAEADRYYALGEVMSRLNYAGNEAARDYLNGDITREQAIDWLVNYTLSSPERAAQRVRFFDAYRSYVINYNLGRDLVADFVERDSADMDTRWQRFTQILSAPVSAEDLR